MILRIQIVTIVWMAIEVILSAIAAVQAHSAAMFGFGGDSAIELASAMIVLMRFRENRHIDEGRAAKITAWLLFALAGFIVADALIGMFFPGLTPKPSYLGIGTLLAAAAIMPWLAAEKRRLSAATGSSALRADATQSSMCAYLAWIALAGLLVNALFHIPWADPLAALALAPIVVREAMEAWRGNACGCD